MTVITTVDLQRTVIMIDDMTVIVAQILEMVVVGEDATPPVVEVTTGTVTMMKTAEVTEEEGVMIALMTEDVAEMTLIVTGKR